MRQCLFFFSIFFCLISRSLLQCRGMGYASVSKEAYTYTRRGVYIHKDYQMDKNPFYQSFVLKAFSHRHCIFLRMIIGVFVHLVVLRALICFG